MAWTGDANEISLALADVKLPQPMEVCTLLDQFLNRLYEVNQTRNLTQVAPEQAIERHLIESLVPSVHFPEGASVCDLGTGPGIPAIPLALALPQSSVTAIDSNQKFTTFVKEVAPSNVECIYGRIEELGFKEKFDVVTGRAVAPLNIQLELSAQMTKIGGIVIPFRTANDVLKPACVAVLGLKLESVVEFTLPTLGILRKYPIYRKVEATPKQYPRMWSVIKKKPMQ